jgi:hypothetical protein
VHVSPMPMLPGAFLELPHSQIPLRARRGAEDAARF